MRDRLNKRIFSVMFCILGPGDIQVPITRHSDHGQDMTLDGGTSTQPRNDRNHNGSNINQTSSPQTNPHSLNTTTDNVTHLHPH